MKFKCGKSKRERNISRFNIVKDWHPYFAWRPIRVESGECVWLEWIERKYPHSWIGQVHGGLYLEAPMYRLP